MSKVYVDSGIFEYIFELLEYVHLESLNQKSLAYISRAMEFCSTSDDGLNIVYYKRNLMFRIINMVFTQEGDD